MVDSEEVRGTQGWHPGVYWTAGFFGLYLGLFAGQVLELSADAQKVYELREKNRELQEQWRHDFDPSPWMRQRDDQGVIV